MVSHPDRPDAHATGARRVVAVFDFDKTISTRDNVLPFLVAAAGRVAVLGALLRSAPDLARGRRDAVKARLVRLLAGREEHEVRAVAAQIATDIIDHHLRPDVVARVRWHQGQGHEIVIVSASFAWYLEPVARRLGVDAVLATGLEVAEGRLTGRLAGANVRRAEKVRRLEVWLGGTPA
ncbi:MAG TPA: HAD-IB family hydrolase, partial [Acidimicrobiia bacterium]|nr:HAD-IB family hydrolase [Acidimicrobiia bacterium]